LGWLPDSAYAGLDSMLQSVTRLEVLRMNKSPHIGNFCWFEDGTSGVCTTAVVPDDLEGYLVNDESPVFYVAHAVPGKWGDFGFRIVSSGADLYTLEYRETRSDGSLKVIMKKDFTFDESLSSYYKKVNFGDLSVAFPDDGLPENFLSAFTNGASAWFSLGGGDNGGKNLTVVDINAIERVIANSNANVVVLNGLTQRGEIIDAFVQVCEKQLRSVFIDIPDLTGDMADVGVYTPNDDVISYTQCHDWVNALYRSEYAQTAAVPDRVTLEEGVVYIWPTVNLFKIYAKMYNDYANVNQVPAGYLCGTIAASGLMDSDFNLYGDELKTDRINYQMIGPRGPVMWEQRTLYALDSDLSYANTVFILRDLRARVLNLMSNYNFRYSTPMDLLGIQSGLDTILGAFKKSLYLVNYTLLVPSFEEAQAEGRDLTIAIDVSVINDMEVIHLNVNLRNASTLRAA
jgi:hypothetical protein